MSGVRQEEKEPFIPLSSLSHGSDTDSDAAHESGGFPQLRILVEGGQSSLSSVFTLCNSAIGAGVLSFPYAFRCAGLVGGIVMTVVVGAIMGFTLFLLVRFTEYYHAHTYQGLVRRAFGKKTALGTALLLALYLFGGCVAYLVIIGDTFASLSLEYFGEGWWSDRRYVIAVVGTLVVLPMCYAKRLGKLAGFSAVAVAGFLYTSAAVLVQGFAIFADRPHRMEHVKLVNWSPALINAIPMMVFGFQCHTNVVTIYQELAPLPSFTGSVRQRVVVVPGADVPLTGNAAHKLLSMKAIVSLAILVIMVGYETVGAAGYLAFPTQVASNVLNTFPSDDLAMQVARFMIGVVVITHYPVNHHPARSAIEDLLRATFGLGPFPRKWRYLQTTVFYALTLLIAILVTDLGKVIHLIGGTAAGFLTFGIPGLLLINSVVDLRVWVKTGNREVAMELQHELLTKRGDDPDAMPRDRHNVVLGATFLGISLVLILHTVYTTVVPISP